MTALWEKALDVIRGEIAAERGRADRAEAALADERALADRLRETLDTTHRDLTAAENRARTAEDAATALRQADTRPARPWAGPLGPSQGRVAGRMTSHPGDTMLPGERTTTGWR